MLKSYARFSSRSVDLGDSCTYQVFVKAFIELYGMFIFNFNFTILNNNTKDDKYQ